MDILLGRTSVSNCFDDAIYAVSIRHDWANTVDIEDRTEEIVGEYRRLVEWQLT